MTTNDHLRQSSQEVLSLVDLRCTKDEGYAEGYAHIGVCARGGSLAELKAKGRVVVHGHHSPILVIYDGGSVFALDTARTWASRLTAAASTTAHAWHPPSVLITALSQGLLREDAGLDVYQMLEASVRQFSEWGHTDAGRHSGCRRAPSRATWQPDDRELRMPTLPNHIEVGFLRRQGVPSERQLLYRG